MIDQLHDYLRRAASRPFAPELMQPICVIAGIALATMVALAGRI